MAIPGVISMNPRVTLTNPSLEFIFPSMENIIPRPDFYFPRVISVNPGVNSWRLRVDSSGSGVTPPIPGLDSGRRHHCLAKPSWSMALMSSIL